MRLYKEDFELSDFFMGWSNLNNICQTLTTIRQSASYFWYYLLVDDEIFLLE